MSVQSPQQAVNPRKEKVVSSNERGVLYQVSKKLRKVEGRVRRCSILNVGVEGDKFTIIENKTVEGGGWKSNRLFTFWFTDRLNVQTTGGYVQGSQKIKKRLVNTEGSYRTFVSFFESCSRYVQKKINRIIKRHTKLKFGIACHTMMNIIDLFYPASKELFLREDITNKELWKRSSDFASPFLNASELLKWLCKPTLKKSFRSKIGFAGKKFMKDFVEIWNSGKRQTSGEMFGSQSGRYSLVIIINNLMSFKGVLTSGDIDIEKLSKTRMSIALNKPISSATDKKLLKLLKLRLRNYLLATKSRVRLINMMHLRDSFHMFETLHSDQVTLDYIAEGHSIEDIHDFMSDRVAEINDPNVDFPAFKFDGVRIGDYTLVAPKDSATLRKWSRYMANCIYSYKQRILDKRAVICGLFDGSVLKYNIALNIQEPIHEQPFIAEDKVPTISVGEINSRFNKGCDKHVRDVILDGLLENGVINVQAKKRASSRLY